MWFAWCSSSTAQKKCISSRWICEIRYGFAVTNFISRLCSNFSLADWVVHGAFLYMWKCKLDVGCWLAGWLACMWNVVVRTIHVFIGDSGMCTSWSWKRLHKWMKNTQKHVVVCKSSFDTLSHTHTHMLNAKLSARTGYPNIVGIYSTKSRPNLSLQPIAKIYTQTVPQKRDPISLFRPLIMVAMANNNNNHNICNSIIVINNI